MRTLQTPLKLAARQKRWLALGLALMLLSLIAGTLLLALSGWFITASALAGLGLLVGLEIFTPGAGIRLAAVTRTLSRYGERLATHAATLRLLTDLRLDLLERLLRLDEAELAALRRADTLNRLTGDVDSLNGLFSGIAGPTAAAALLSLLAALGLSLAHPALGLVISPPLLILIPLLGWVLFRLGQRPGAESVTAIPGLRSCAADGIEGVNELRAFDRTEHQTQALARLSERLGQLQQRLGELDAIGQSLAVLITGLAVWIALVAAIHLFQQDQIGAAVAALVVLATFGLAEAWLGIPVAWRRFGQSLAAGERIEHLARPRSALPVAANPAAWPKQADVMFDKVHFGYGQHLPPVLSDLNLAIGHGEHWLISGASGIGKTTLAMLAMRRYDPRSGTVRIGGQDLRTLNPDDLRRRIAWLPQRPVLLRDSLAANLRLARGSASDDELINVLTAVGLEQLLSELPDGLESWVDEDGANLSGGQRQRLAIARLLLTDPDIVLLDEPTASLDPATAELVMTSLNDWLEGRTAVFISHGPPPGTGHYKRLNLTPPRGQSA